MLANRIIVLIIEDNPLDAELAVAQLQRDGFAVDWQRVETEREFLSGLAETPDIILADSNLPQFDALRALDLLRERNLEIPFILVSGRMDEKLGVDAMRRGAHDYLLKDRLVRLGEAVRRGIEQRQLREDYSCAAEALRQSEERQRRIEETLLRWS